MAQIHIKITGPPSAGKTTVADIIANALDAAMPQLIDKLSIYEVNNFDGIATNSKYLVKANSGIVITTKVKDL